MRDDYLVLPPTFFASKKDGNKHIALENICVGFANARLSKFSLCFSKRECASGMIKPFSREFMNLDNPRTCERDPITSS